MSDSLRPEDACGCCEPAVAATPATIWNRPGLGAIGYRVGTYATFRQAMLTAIAGRPELARYTARGGDDFGVALISMWAYLADILTFYQERAANESYLRTAMQRESLVRLAALLDYRPAPGVAASAYLAFTLERGKSLAIPAGLRVQSVPGPDEKPQKYESFEALAAEAALNEVRVFPLPQTVNSLAAGRDRSLLQPGAPAPARGDRLLLFRRGTPVLSVGAAPGSRAFGSLAAAGAFLASSGFSVATIGPALAASRAGGASADTLLGAAAEPLDSARLVRLFEPAVSSWAGADPRRAEVGARLLARELARLVGSPAPGPAGVEEKVVTGLETSDDMTTLRWSPPVQGGGFTLANAAVRRWVRKLRLFGHNSPESFLRPETPNGNASDIRWRVVTAGSKEYSFSLPAGDSLTLDALYDDLKAGTALLVAAPDFTQLVTVTEVAQATGSHGPQEAPATSVQLSATLQAIDDRRHVVLYELSGPELALWGRAFAPTIGGNRVYAPLEALPALTVPRTLVLDDAAASPQVVTATAAAPTADGYLAITVSPALARPLDTASATMRANVALATHGETVAREVLGDGDAAAAFQSFRLQKTPLTYLPQPGAPNGAASTLELRVDSVLWREVSTLYGRRPDERVYVAAQDPEGKTVLRFGDGVTGARLPSGRGNVVARYRVGLGEVGEVAAASLATLLDRPVGLRGVTNPLPAEGGADPESLEQARANAPNTVRTFGRIVSLRDFEDAAREFAGVAKARAIWVWEREEQVVRLVVAGDGGDAITGLTLANLVADLDSRRDPNRKLVVGPHRPLPVEIRAGVGVDAAYLADEVLAAAHQALLDHMAFEARAFGQPVHLSDIAAALQAVPGVVFADIDRLQLKRAADRLSHGATAAAVQSRLRVEAHELAVLEDPAADAVVTLV